jgi:glycosyltransferase involved in cell wall biosynthesis
MTSWLLISGDFTPAGGMDRANHALATYLSAQPDTRVHLVTHRASRDLADRPSIHVHHVARPGGLHLLGAPLLEAAGKRWTRRLRAEHPAVIANGGNADVRDVTWVHYLHAAHAPAVAGSATRRLRTHIGHRYFASRERAALTRARLVICNSRRTARDVIERVGVPPSRVHTVYYGSDASQLSLVTPEQRRDARRALGWGADRRVALFVGALGDRRKGFDRLFEAWSALLTDKTWDVDLAAAGEGRELESWRTRAARFNGRIRLLGFRDDVPRLLAASDLLVHPARYEAYGLGVHEAICRGLPAVVSADAGVAEQYPPDLHDLLLQDVERVDELTALLRRWRKDDERYAARVQPFADRLRGRSWHDMAADIAAAVRA